MAAQRRVRWANPVNARQRRGGMMGVKQRLEIDTPLGEASPAEILGLAVNGAIIELDNGGHLLRIVAATRPGWPGALHFSTDRRQPPSRTTAGTAGPRRCGHASAASGVSPTPGARPAADGGPDSRRPRLCAGGGTRGASRGSAVSRPSCRRRSVCVRVNRSGGARRRRSAQLFT